MKYVFFCIILLISLVVINNLLRSIVNLTQKQDLINHAQQQLEKEQKENQTLKQQLLYVNKQQFVEEQARNKLFMVKEGEQIVIIPSTSIQASNEASMQQVVIKSPFSQWLELFFNSGE